MIQHDVTIHLKRPVEQVFAFLADYQNLRTWQSNLLENEQLTEGPLRVDTRFREVRRTGPGQSEIQAEITDFESNKRFGTRTITKPQVTVSYSLEGENGGTRLNYKFVMLTSGMMRLLEPLIAGSIRKDTNLDFQKLKHILES
ncbi:MAG: SRPBCC family protein [Chloroflexota bacterium]|nr:SRPBCC family protein [Chloroflexota bacterium]